MSEMGVDKNSVLEASSPTCATPARTDAADEENAGVTPCAEAGVVGMALQEHGATATPPPVAGKKKKKKKKKAGGYKAFLKSAMRSTKDDAAKKEQHRQKIASTMGGGAFDKMADKL